MKTAIELISDERQRQIQVEGHTLEHDNHHTKSELSVAAACYAMSYLNSSGAIPPIWPWSANWWKPTPNNRVRELVKAGALIVAEIERLQRQAK